MRPKIIILLSAIACIGGIVFFLACKYTYEFKVTELKEKAKETFTEALDKELKNRNINGGLSFYFNSESAISTEMPDSVYWEDASGRHLYRMDSKKNSMNITHNSNLRALHTFIFYEKPLQPDSLNLIWDEQLNKADIYLESALRISLTHEDGSVESQKTYQSEWGNSSNLVFTFYIGYACEIEVMGYLHYTLWGMIYKEVLLYLLLFIIVGYGFYTFFIILSRRINSLRSKEIVEIIKETPVEILKEVPVEIIKEVQVEKQIIKEVQRVDIIPLHSYILGESLIFYADQNIIEVNDVKYNIQGQSSLLLELFFQEKDNGYTLKEDFIIEKLWPDNSGNDERMHKAIGRLRSFLRKIDPSLSIINKNGTYRLIISEKSLVKRNS